MMVEYRGRKYRHQQMWSLVAALSADGWYVRFGAMPESGPWAQVRRYKEVDGIATLVESYLRRGSALDLTPFNALVLAIEQLKRSHKEE